ncbi:MAG: hypothetical protein ACLQAT_28145 [Candidatus Binataceae bacterium]
MAKTNRLEGIGEFHFPGEAGRRFARRRFFEALAAVCPKLLETLEGPYSVARKEKIELASGSETPAEELAPKLAKLRRAIDKWCVRWNLKDGWCRDLAYDTVLAWIRTPSWNGKWAPDDSEWLEVVSFPCSSQFTFSFRPWRFVLERGTEYEANLKNSFENQLKQHLEAAEHNALKRCRLIRSKAKRESDHFYWLARRFFGQTGADMARSMPRGLTPRAIEKAIKSLADYLQLSLPPTRKTRRSVD